VAIGCFGYVGILIVLLALERKFIFIPTPATSDWRTPADPRITDFAVVSATGESIHGWWLPRSGARGALLYSHGNAGNLSHRGPSIVRWADELGMSVLIYDYPGYGKSTGQPTEENCYSASEAAWTWLTQHEQIELQNILLVGASLGGAMAVDLATRHDCRAVVLIKAFSSIPDMATYRFPWLPARYFVRSQFDSAAKLCACKRPVFLVHGTGDSIVPYECSEKLFAAASEPKELMTVDGNEHNDALPADFFSRLRSFLESHTPMR
jgi:fermentation-respiration switch protein FrsA (DUF1100 family)